MPSLLIPLVVLALAVVVVSYRSQIQDWPGLLSFRIVPVMSTRADQRAAAEAQPVPEGTAPAPSPVPPPAPLTAEEIVALSRRAGNSSDWLDPQGVADPDAVAAGAEGEEPVPSATTTPEPKAPKPPPTPIGFHPPADEKTGSGQPQGGESTEAADSTRRITKEEYDAVIQDVARQKKKEEQHNVMMRGEWDKLARRQAQQKRDERIAEAIRANDEDRPKFRAELQQILESKGNMAGNDIRKLCDRYGLGTLPEIEEFMKRSVNGRGEKLRRADRIRLLRYCGLPESMVLGDLANSEVLNIGARGGPRNQAETWVRAARQLLKLPLIVSRDKPNPFAAPPPPGFPPSGGPQVAK
jgi:hypothetical protein